MHIKRFFGKKKGLIVFIVIAIISIAVVFQLFFAPKKIQVKQATVSTGDVVEELSLSGVIDAEEKANLQFQSSGLLSWVGVKKGDKVIKYQTLASLDQRTVEKNLKTELIDYSKQRNTFDQFTLDQQANKPKDAVNDRMKRLLENNQYDLDAAINSVELVDISRQLSSIYTPIEGTVTSVTSPFAGVNITAGVSQFTVINPLTIHMAITADQTEIVNIKEGQKGVVVFDSYPEEEIEGVIKSVSFTQKTDESGTVYEAKVELLNIENSNYKYRMGMTGDITFITKGIKNALNLPSIYVKSDDKGKYVFKDKNKKNKTYVKTGLEGANNIEIKEGLVEDEIVYD